MINSSWYPSSLKLGKEHYSAKLIHLNVATLMLMQTFLESKSVNVVHLTFKVAGSGAVRIDTPKLACRLSSSLPHWGLILGDLPTAENRDIQTRRRTHQRTSQFICLSSWLRL